MAPFAAPGLGALLPRGFAVSALLILAACGGESEEPLVALAGSDGQAAASSNAGSAPAPVAAPAVAQSPAAPPPASAPAPATATQTAAAPATPTWDDYNAALAMWRVTRPKDACMSCHGPDFFDIARIGTTDADIIRRSIIDGANQQEAEALVRGVNFLKLRYALKPENPRTFRPFQPGGEVLPGETNVARDAAFGAELQKFMPTLAGAKPIRSLAEAKKARDELLANDFSRMRIGIPFPLWSADIVHGPQEGTMDDWIADLPAVPIPERRAEWIAVQDAYLANPSDENFWKLYFAVDEMTVPFAELTPFVPSDAGKPQRLQTMKFKSALIGQHALRVEAMNRTGFMRRDVAFAYLAEEPWRTQFGGKSATVKNKERLPGFLPNPWWEVGELARSQLRASTAAEGQPGSSAKSLARDTMKLVGNPDFVVESLDPALTTTRLSSNMQLSWFMLGVRLDPGLRRINQTNSALSGEYLTGALNGNNYWIHRTYQTALRMVMSTYNPAAQRSGPVPYRLNFGYLTAYQRHMPSRWNPDLPAAPAEVREAQLAAFKQLTGNFFRMSLYLHEEELMTGRIAPYGDAKGEGDFGSINSFFDYAGLPGRADDDALIRRVAARAQKTLTF